MIRKNLEVGDPVIQIIPNFGNIHGKIYDITTLSDGTPIYKIKLTPKNYIEETLLEGLLGYNRKCECNFWSLKMLDDGSIISYDNHKGMFRVDTRY